MGKIKYSLFERIKPILPHVLKPARYIGNEINMVKKDPACVALRMVVSYPDVYDIGMSNLGVRIIYDVVNRQEHLYCERIFSPWLDFEEKLRDHDIPLFSLETFTPINQFDVMGFSVGSELLYTNILNILDLGKVGIFSKDRNNDEPIVVAGGPAIYNPEPLAEYIDVFLFGDGEHSIIELLNRLLTVKNESRLRKLEELDTFSFTYVPSLYKTHSINGYTFTTIEKDIVRRVETDLNNLPYPQKPLVPLTKIVQDRIPIEVSRGCINGCRFCQAGYTYRPVRERNLETILKIAEESINNTGYDELSLLSLSIGDYSRLKELVALLTERFSQRMVSLSLPSLRVSSTNLDILEKVREVRKSGLTFALESADTEVQNGLNKPIDRDRFFEIVEWVINAGWRHIKLYFMIGLPTAINESEQIHALVFDLIKLSKRLSVNLNLSTFVPKPHTPFERERQINIEESERVINEIRKRCHHSRVNIKYQNPGMSFVEGILSRGDRSIGRLVYEVFKAGERFSSWDEVFDITRWEECLKKLEIEKDHYTNYSDTLGLLPWDFVSTGVKKQFINEERKKASISRITESCLKKNCAGCGVCDEKIKPHHARQKSIGKYDYYSEQKTVNKKISGIRCKMIFKFTKIGVFKYISHLDLLHYLVKMGRRAEIPFRYSEGYNPKPRITIPFPLPLGIESLYELGEVWLQEAVSEEDFIEMYNNILDGGIKIMQATVTHENASIASRDFFHDYKIICAKDIQDEICARLQGVMEGNIEAKIPIPCFSRDGSAVLLRLRGSESIKRSLAEYQDYSIARTMIWEVVKDKLKSFIE